MKGFNMTIQEMTDLNKRHMCAWCRRYYDHKGNPVGKKVDDAIYATIESHGICNLCHNLMKRETLKRKLVLG